VADAKRRAPITPATRVAELLESWPELEEVLIAQAPAFRRLRNPVLRRTVARVATLEQAAGVGGVAVRDLVAALRRAAGLDVDAAALDSGPGTESASSPAWLETLRLALTIDADELLDRGEAPLARVNAEARLLRPGEMLRVRSSFRPVPLADALVRQGFATFVRADTSGEFETFVAARAAANRGLQSLQAWIRAPPGEE
jgi:hypothetical protein